MAESAESTGKCLGIRKNCLRAVTMKDLAVISGRLMNVIASDCGHPDLNEQTLPIAIPIDKGLLGYRVSLIRRDQQARINKVNDIQGLRLLSVGQAQD